MKFSVEIPDAVVDRLLAVCRSTDGDRETSYADAIQFILVESPISTNCNVLYTDVVVDEL